jgi:hypothetical protein
MKWIDKLFSIKDAYNSVFNTPAGKTVLLDLMRIGCVGKSTVIGAKSRDAILMNEGARVIVLHIIRQLNKDNAALLGLIEEGIQEEDERYE